MQPFTLSADQIVPRIILDLPARSATDFVLSGEDAPLERHLVADLSVTYAFDLPGCFKIASRRDIAHLVLEESQVHDLAMRNLDMRMSKLEPEFVELENDVVLIRCGGDFEATLLLFDHVWQQAMNVVRGELVVSVPARDSIAFTGTENRPGLSYMRSEASRILERSDHTLTRNFLTRNASGWIRYEGFAS